ncbi:unnamed protein product [Periconia digitata]|uniref:Uncharacterized protein n=1 Tax=Periconia digitata TaxID=1303443 RepID=A0A9W4U2F5_9PLEO|nr:unnamed protein product [Periconia digitata]
MRGRAQDLALSTVGIGPKKRKIALTIVLNVQLGLLVGLERLAGVFGLSRTEGARDLAVTELVDCFVGGIEFVAPVVAASVA